MWSLVERSSVGSMVVAIALISTHAGSAPSNADKATAQTLFDDGLKLLGKKQYAEACSKLEESQRLDPGMGTQYRLAECYEKLGRVASAWAQYREVVDAAKAAGLPDRERKARERAAAIEPRLPRLIIAVPAPVKGLHVMRDGAEIGQGQYGSAVPVDPGPHNIEAKAAGFEGWSSKVDIAEKATLTVTVPELKASSTAGKSETPVAKETGRDTRTLGLVVASVGVVGLAASGLLMLGARSTYAESDAHCVGNTCDAEGVDIRDRARGRGNVATVVFGVGAAALVAGGVLWLTSPSPSYSGASSGLRVGLSPFALTLGGRF